MLQFIKFGIDAPDEANWISIADETVPSGNFFSVDWDANDLSGKYTLRLTVNDLGSSIVVKRKDLYIFSEKLGDVNDDGVVDAKDAKEILRHVVGLPPADQFIESRADVSKNGSVTAYDATLIFQMAAGLVE